MVVAELPKDDTDPGTAAVPREGTLREPVAVQQGNRSSTRYEMPEFVHGGWTCLVFDQVFIG